ncbi:MAG TPA: methyltransferase domain-containing protein [Cyclobacteriaceae bacterium]|nr:methyltransferase domain-containing protein [Cyclobacteriaceae bacterium]HRJ80936.1 methyltransferase domain-containing protein [Cyclobacteriaceae bacterium]
MTEQKNFIPALKYDWLTKFYDPVLQLTMPERKFKKALIDKMRIERGYRVLDFGCGSLTLSLMAAQMYPEAEYYGVDIDEKILAIASRKMAAANKHVLIQHYDGTKLPYPDNYFDRVMSSLVFHHLTLRQKYAVLEDIYRILKPGGEVHIADFGQPSNVLQRIGFYTVQLLDGFETTNDSVKNTLPKALKENDFSDVEEKGVFKTLVGTVRLVKAVKPVNSIL